MKKVLILLIVLSMSVSLFACANRAQETIAKTNLNDNKEVANLVENFGKKLQLVSLLAPKDILIKSMQENYGNFVTLELLSKWESDPLNAPGRLVSSPWPDRIDIQSVKQISKDSYEVKGEIIEITSVEQKSGGIAAKRPITLTVKKIDDRFLITDVTLGAYEDSSAIIYKNTLYGFNFSLPQSWAGYTIVKDQWEGLDVRSGKVVERGPIIKIRHPLWTKEKPRQDIPIMIFTLAQWNSLQKGNFHIGAAPIGPKELGRNSKYVFALPARYNFAFLPGYEEVEQILNSNALKQTEVFNQ